MTWNTSLNSQPSKFHQLSRYIFFFILALLVVAGVWSKLDFKTSFNHFFNYRFLTGFMGFPEVVRPGEELAALKYILKPDNKTGKQKDLERLDILLSPKSFKQIQKDRKKLVSERINSKSSKKVKAGIVFQGQEYKAKVKLKGLYGDHWIEPERYSFNVELKNGGNLQGISRFAVQKASTRNYGVDYAMSKFIRSFDILSPEHFFFKTTLNGFNWGIMDVEEKLDKYFLENKKRKEALIFQLVSDADFTTEIRRKSLVKKNPEFESYHNPSLNFSDFRVVNKVDYLENQIFNNYYNYFARAFKRDLINKDNIGDYFDFDSYAKGFLLVSASGNCHGLIGINRYEYLNPYTLKLELITTDNSTVNDLEKSKAMRWCKRIYPFSVLFQNKEFLKNVKKNLSIFDDTNVLDDINEDLERVINYKVNNLAESFPLYGSSKKFKGFDVELLKSNLNFIKENKQALKNIFNEQINVSNLVKKKKFLDNAVSPKVYEKYLKKIKSSKTLLDAYVDEKKNLQVVNLTNTNVKLDFIGFGKKALARNKILKAHGNFEINKIPFEAFQPIKIKYSVGKFNFKKVVENNFTTNLYNPLLQYNVPEYIVPEPKGYVIREGVFKVKSPIVIPKGKYLKIEAGVSLVFDKASYLVINGPLKALGTKEKPIKLHSVDGLWRGVYVHKSSQKSVLKHTEISNLENLHDGVLNLTGAVSFYKSDVLINHLKIKNVKGEDGLNVIGAKIEAKNLIITKTKSDAFDGDFVTGSISNSFFSKVKGDGIDISGSDLKVTNSRIKNIKDKALSIGEQSKLKAKDLKIENIGTGVAVKDGSRAKISSTKIINSSFVDAATYIKKEHYLTETKLSIRGLKKCIPKKLLRESKTKFKCNGKKVKSSKVDVDALYDTVMKK